MRISKNDIVLNMFRRVIAHDTEGYEVSSWTATYTGIYGDLQPIGGNIQTREYGIESVTAETRILFFDSEVDFIIGDIVQYGSTNYMCKGLKKWYSHQEAIVEPFEVTITTADLSDLSVVIAGSSDRITFTFSKYSGLSFSMDDSTFTADDVIISTAGVVISGSWTIGTTGTTVLCEFVPTIQFMGIDDVVIVVTNNCKDTTGTGCKTTITEITI